MGRPSPSSTSRCSTSTRTRPSPASSPRSCWRPRWATSMSKEEILESYLNTVYFGRGAYGIEAASQAYFGKPAAELTDAEAIALTAIVNNPGNLDPAKGEKQAADLLERYQYTINGLVEMGKMTEAEKAEIYCRTARVPEVERDSQYGGPKGFLLNMVQDELKAKGFTEDQIAGGGLHDHHHLRRRRSGGCGRIRAEDHPADRQRQHQEGHATCMPGWPRSTWRPVGCWPSTAAPTSSRTAGTGRPRRVRPAPRSSRTHSVPRSARGSRSPTRSTGRSSPRPARTCRFATPVTATTARSPCSRRPPTRSTPPMSTSS